jgi:hypothetical protein
VWEEYCQELPLVDIKINHCFVLPTAALCELIGFCDASMAAYSAVVYLKSVFTDGSQDISIVIVKTKVAPLKEISLPCVELCSVILLARLIRLVQNLLNMDIQEVSAWSNSTMVLTWLVAPLYKWENVWHK